MTRSMAYVAVAVLVLGSGVPVSAQQPGHPHGAGHQPPGAAQPMDEPGRPSPQMMPMCRQMMGHSGPMGGMGGGMMGGGIMGTMPMMGGEPKQQADMMAMRGEMMKAMGDIMVKYAERMRPAK